MGKPIDSFSNLRTKEWAKRDKKTPKVGVDDKLKTFEKVFLDTVPPLNELGRARGKDEVDAAMKKAKTAAGKVPAVIKAAEALAAQCKLDVSKAKTIKDFPAKSREMLEQYIKDAENCAIQMKTLAPAMINEAINSLNDYEKRKLALLVEIKRITEGTEKLEVRAKGLLKNAVPVHAEAMKTTDPKRADQAAKACETMRDTIEGVFKSSQELSEKWRLSSGEMTGFLSQNDKKTQVVPMSNRLMTANKGIKKAVDESRTFATKAREAATKLSKGGK